MRWRGDDRWRSRRRLGWGVFLILVGAWALLSMGGFLPELSWTGWWPWLVVAIGVISVITACGPRRIGSGVTTIGIGLWCAAATQHWYGLHWGNSWPLALVAVGLGTLAEWAAAVLAPRREEGGDHVL